MSGCIQAMSASLARCRPATDQCHLAAARCLLTSARCQLPGANVGVHPLMSADIHSLSACNGPMSAAMRRCRLTLEQCKAAETQGTTLRPGVLSPLPRLGRLSLPFPGSPLRSDPGLHALAPPGPGKRRAGETPALPGPSFARQGNLSWCPQGLSPGSAGVSPADLPSFEPKCRPRVSFSRRE